MTRQSGVPPPPEYLPPRHRRPRCVRANPRKVFSRPESATPHTKRLHFYLICSSAHSDTKQGRKQHGRIHDVILFYTRGDGWSWNALYTPYDQEYLNAFYKHIEPGTGRRYRLGDLTAPGGAAPAKRNPHYEFLGVTRYWRDSKENKQKLHRDGRPVP